MPAYYNEIDSFCAQFKAEVEWAWIDAVRTDLDGVDYAFGACVAPAAGVGAPHIRQRLWFVAVASHRSPRAGSDAQRKGSLVELSNACREEGVADAAGARRIGPVEGTEGKARDETRLLLSGADGTTGELGHSQSLGRLGRPDDGDGGRRQRASRQAGEVGGSGAGFQERERDRAIQRGEMESSTRKAAFGGSNAGFWFDCEWLPCTDGKARPVKPGIFPLAHGIPGRVALLRAAGNAIVTQLAAQFIQAAEEAVSG